MKTTTLLFLVKNNEVCLAMKKRGFGVGRYNGVGGKLVEGETIEQAVARETKEEIGVDVLEMKKSAILDFNFLNKPEWNQVCHVFLCQKWSGEPSESEEMSPKWFKIDKIPYDKMWPDDPFWLPRVLAGEYIKAKFSFCDGDSILDKDVQAVNAQRLAP